MSRSPQCLQVEAAKLQAAASAASKRVQELEGETAAQARRLDQLAEATEHSSSSALAAAQRKASLAAELQAAQRELPQLRERVWELQASLDSQSSAARLSAGNAESTHTALRVGGGLATFLGAFACMGRPS